MYPKLLFRAVWCAPTKNGRCKGQWRLEDRNDLKKLMPRVMRGKLEALIDGITKNKVELSEEDEFVMELLTMGDVEWREILVDKSS
nr:hypothetical protein [Tanacetum cinerariifolium]